MNIFIKIEINFFFFFSENLLELGRVFWGCRIFHKLGEIIFCLEQGIYYIIDDKEETFCGIIKTFSRRF
jgi:hypothetical protein